MRDLGLVEVDEPAVRLLSQGMVLKDGSAMSKSRGNVVEPDEVVGRHGADTLRLYVLFEAPPEKEITWTDQRLEGPSRFLQRIWRLVDQERESIQEAAPAEGAEHWNAAENALRRKTHQTIMRVTRDVEERLHLNTAIAAIMELTNEVYRNLEPRPERDETWTAIREATEAIIVLLNPFAPHITEELWEMLGHKKRLTVTPWPAYDPSIATQEEVTLVLQVNGKIRNRISVPVDMDEEKVRQMVLEDDTIKSAAEGKTVQRVIVVPRRLVNVVVG